MSMVDEPIEDVAVDNEDDNAPVVVLADIPDADVAAAEVGAA